jgi:hypothetical protein
METARIEGYHPAMFILSWLADHGPDVLTWAATAVTALAGRFIGSHVKHAGARAILERATTEVVDSAAMVAKTYAAALKTAAADGKLTAAEKAEAKAKAIAAAKANLGKAGIAKLQRVAGKDVNLDTWLATKLESALHRGK